MTRPPKKIRTFHHLVVAESLAEQSQRAIDLLQTARAVLNWPSDQPIPPVMRARLAETMNALESALWPHGEQRS
jgi:hypothetical protein